MAATPQLIHLPDDLPLYTFSERETRFIHKEIFIDHCYDTVSNLPNNPFVVDAGANIGLFSLYVKKKHPEAKILAFEPAPQTYQTLCKNLELHGCKDDVQAQQCGLGKVEGSARLTFYPHAPGNSTLFPEQKDSLKAMVSAKFPDVDPAVIEQRLNLGSAETADVPVKRLSSFLHAVHRVDLLKLDVEGAEFDILAGLDDEHWQVVQNIVMELSVIGDAGALERMKALLEGRGFVVRHEATHPDWKDQFYLVTATRETV